MKILVTGGAGYIGSVVAEQLLERGDTVIVVDNLSTGKRAHVPRDARFLQCDVGDVERITALLRDNAVDVVMHFAAASLVGESMSDPEHYFQNNVAQTFHLLKAMRAAGCSRLIFSSTAAVYGQPIHIPITEEHPTAPINPYGLSKLMMEQALAWYGQAYGFRYTIFRYFNAAGATTHHGEDRDVETHLIPLLLQTALGRRDTFTLYGDDYDTPDGTCIRDYIHVADIADAHIRAIAHLEKRPAAIYNLGTGKGSSNREVIDMVREVSGKDLNIQTGSRRAGDPGILVASAQKAREELGWQPQYSDLRQIVESAWRFNMTNDK